MAWDVAPEYAGTLRADSSHRIAGNDAVGLEHASYSGVTACGGIPVVVLDCRAAAEGRRLGFHETHTVDVLKLCAGAPRGLLRGPESALSAVTDRAGAGELGADRKGCMGVGSAACARMLTLLVSEGGWNPGVRSVCAGCPRHDPGDLLRVPVNSPSASPRITVPLIVPRCRLRRRSRAHFTLSSVVDGNPTETTSTARLPPR